MHKYSIETFLNVIKQNLTFEIFYMKLDTYNN